MSRGCFTADVSLSVNVDLIDDGVARKNTRRLSFGLSFLIRGVRRVFVVVNDRGASREAAFLNSIMMYVVLFVKQYAHVLVYAYMVVCAAIGTRSAATTESVVLSRRL